MTYPVAEIFTAPQGEGLWAGTLMTFVRLAGCTVGKPYLPGERQGLYIYQEKCTAWNGNTFPCDTNYRKTEALTPEEILARCDAPRVCITGGEPLMHGLEPLIALLRLKEKFVHIETSGTINIAKLLRVGVWVTVSPKQGYLTSSLYLADELKILVDSTFNEAEFRNRFHEYLDGSNPIVWLQPINEANHIRTDNMIRCLEIQGQFPKCRISTQLHKIWGVR